MSSDDNPLKGVGEQEAQALRESRWWEGKPAREIAERQLFIVEDICPTDVFRQALEGALSRPVARLEAQTDLGRVRLRKEFRGELKPPTPEELMGLAGADRRTIVVETHEEFAMLGEEDLPSKLLERDELSSVFEDLLDLRRVGRAIAGLPPDPVENDEERQQGEVSQAVSEEPRWNNESQEWDIGKERAIALYNTEWWKIVPRRDIARFQLFIAETCCPNPVYAPALEELLDRSIPMEEAYTPGAFVRIRREFLARQNRTLDPPTLDELTNILPPDSREIISGNKDVARTSENLAEHAEQQGQGGIRRHLEKKGLLQRGLERLKNILKPPDQGQGRTR
jgi:hypothetical protein